MKFSLYSIRDSKAGIFLSPFPARSDVDAERTISASQNDPALRETPVFTHAPDFALYHIAYFDDESGSVEPVTPRLLATVASLFAPAQLPS